MEVTNPLHLGTSLFGIQIHEGTKCFESFAPEDVQMNSREVHGSVTKKSCQEKKLALRIIQGWGW